MNEPLVDYLGREIRIGDILVFNIKGHYDDLRLGVVVKLGKVQVTIAGDDWKTCGRGLNKDAGSCMVVTEQVESNSWRVDNKTVENVLARKKEVDAFLLSLRFQLGEGFSPRDISDETGMPVARIKTFIEQGLKYR